MGNAISPSCLQPQVAYIKLYLYDGTTRVLPGKRLVAEIKFEFLDCMVCHADSFFIGCPLPSLTFAEQLINRERYFVLPIDSFPPDRPLSVSSLIVLTSSELSSGSKRAPNINFSAHQPFEFLKGIDGNNRIKVSPDFIVKLMSRGKDNIEDGFSRGNYDNLCRTPKLKKHYDHLVGSRGQVWSPRLETILESKSRSSPWLCILVDSGEKWKGKK